VAIKQKRQNYGIGEFVLSAFGGDNQVVGRFDDQQTVNLPLKYNQCSNGASVCIQFLKYILIIFLY
jgi:hypothetical protein